MFRMRDLSITQKLTWMNMLVSGAALLVATAAFLGYARSQYRQGIVRNLSIKAQLIGINSVSAVIFGDPQSAEATLSALRADPTILSAWIFTPQGQPFASYHQGSHNSAPQLPAIPPGETETYSFNDGNLVLVRSIVFDGKQDALVYIQSSLAALYERQKRYLEIGGLVLLASLLAALLVSRAARKSVALPIHALSETARAVSRDKDYSIRAARTESHDEISTLIDTFNEMLTRIQERDDAVQKAHAALVEERYLLHTLMDDLPDGIYFKDRASRFTRVSKSHARAFGLMEPAQAVGKTDSDFFTPEHAEEARSDEERVMETGQPLVGKEEKETWQNGRETWALTTKMPWRDATGKIMGTFGVTHDITKRKQIESALRESEEHFRSLFENMLNGYAFCKMVFESDQPTDFIYLDVNKSFEPLTGLKNVIGRKASDVIPGIRESDPHVLMTYGRVARSGVSEKFETYVESMKKWFAISLYSPKKDHFVAVFDAITERKEAEADLQKLNEQLEHRVADRTAELQVINKELEAFTYSVSHDLRAPLRHIDGFSRLLKEEIGGQLDETSRHYLQRIQEGTTNMGRLVDDLLNLARIGRRELSRQVTGLHSIVNEVVADLNSETNGREITWQVGQLPFVECDPSLMKQVFVNLLSNAYKYTRPRKPAVIEVGQTRMNGDTVVFVRDNGVGFSMKYADKLFGVFQRLHRAEDFEGTGVGLATVQRIIHRHGGRVWAEAELDKGATFYFTLAASANLEARDTATVQAERKQ